MKEKVKKIVTRRLVVTFFLIIYALILIVTTRSAYLKYKEIGEQYVSIFFKNIKTQIFGSRSKLFNFICNSLFFT